MGTLEYLKTWGEPDPEDKPGSLISLMTVLITGIVIGFFIWKACFSYISTPFNINFDAGQWITTGEPSSQGYFRKTLYLTNPIKEAWIQIAGTDSFILYINEKVIGSENLSITNALGMYDIGSYLTPGKNVICVEVRSTIYQRSVKVIIEGEYLYASGKTFPLFSDSSWKESTIEESMAKGKIPWTSQEFNADDWSYVRIDNDTKRTHVPPLSIHPALISTPVKGGWLSSINPTQAATFYKTFEIHRQFQDAWIRMNAQDNFTLMINGNVINSRNSLKNTLSIFNITPFLKHGQNRIEITVTTSISMSPSLIMEGFLSVSGKVHKFLSTDLTWEAADTKNQHVKSAVMMTNYSSFRDRLVKRADIFTSSVGYTLKQLMKELGCIFLITLIVFFSWRWSVYPIQWIKKEVNRFQLLKADAIFHLPALLFLGGMYLFQYDIRFTPSFSFQKGTIVAAIIIILSYRLSLLFELLTMKFPMNKRVNKFDKTTTTSHFRKYKKIYASIAILTIPVAGYSFRLQNAGKTSLSHDEIGIATVSQEVIKRGYPIIQAGPLEKQLTTYELLPYPIALSLMLLGDSDFAIRFPSLIFGTLVLLLVFYMGCEIWGIWTGLLAAAIYAFLPFSIFWGSNGFHPQQAQFFTFLTAYLFYKTIHSDCVINPRYMVAASISFIFTYLTWEGSGLLLILFFLTLLERRRLDFSWLKSGTLWICITAVGIVVLIQLAFRTLANAPYIMVGKGLSGQVLKLFFMDPTYNGWYYIKNYLLCGNHIVLTLLILVGIPFINSDRGMRYCLTIEVGLLMMLTNFMPNSSVRYAYFIQPFLVLPAAAIVVHFSTAVRNMKVTRILKTVQAAKYIFITGFTLLIILASGTHVLKIYELGFSNLTITNETLPMIDYRSMNQYLDRHKQPDDIIISLMPHTVKYYTGQEVDYYIQAYTSQQLFYVDRNGPVGYLDKYSGSTVIRNINEFKDVVHRHQRVWIMAMPYTLFQSSNDDAILDYIKKNATVKYETFKGKIMLWE